MANTLTQSIRTAIVESGLGHNELARQTGIPQPTISRFVNGADMKLATADRLAAFLGLEITRRRIRRKPGD